MLTSPGLSRRVLLVFTTGIGVGFFVTYLLVSSSQTSGRGAKRRVAPAVPHSPYTHEDTEDFTGPEHAQEWSDHHHHHYGT